MALPAGADLPEGSRILGAAAAPARRRARPAGGRPGRPVPPARPRARARPARLGRHTECTPPPRAGGGSSATPPARQNQARTKKGPARRSSRSTYIFPMRKMPLLHLGQVPFTAGRPFFIIVSLGFFMAVFFLHLTQYASTMPGRRDVPYLAHACEKYHTTRTPPSPRAGSSGPRPRPAAANRPPIPRPGGSGPERAPPRVGLRPNRNHA